MCASVEYQNKKLENLGECLGDDETISKLAGHEVGRNNTKGVECCKVFSSGTIGQVSLLRVGIKDDCK